MDPPRRRNGLNHSDPARPIRRGGQRKTNLTADDADTRPGAPGGQFASAVLIRAYPRHPRFSFAFSQFDNLRGTQRNGRLVVQGTPRRFHLWLRDGVPAAGRSENSATDGTRIKHGFSKGPVIRVLSVFHRWLLRCAV